MATHSSILAWRIPWKRSLVGYGPRGHKELDITEKQNILYFRLTLFNKGRVESVDQKEEDLFQVEDVKHHPKGNSPQEKFPGEIH